MKNLKESTEDLILSIKRLGKSRNDIADYLKMEVASINSAISRGGNAKLYSKIEAYYKHLKETNTEEYNIGEAIKKIEAMSSVMLTAIAEVIANQKSQMSSVVRNELEKMVNEQLAVS